MSSGMAASANGNLSWTPPPWSTLNFTRDCDAYAKYVVAYARDGGFGGPSLSVVEEYFRSALPAGFAPQPSQWQILEWYDKLSYNWTSDLNIGNANLTETWFAGMDVCHDQLCALIGFQGNADLAGIGVVVGYSIEAGLVTLYAAAFLFAHFSKRRRQPPSENDGGTTEENHDSHAFAHFTKRTLDAFRGSTASFTVAAAILSLAMFVAGIRITQNASAAAIGWQPGTDDVGAYDIQLATLASLFSVFPVFVLAALERQGAGPRRRSWMRRGVMALLYGIMMVALGVAMSANYPGEMSDQTVYGCTSEAVDNLWEDYLMTVFTVGVTLPMVFCVVSAVVGGCWRSRERRRRRTVRALLERQAKELIVLSTSPPRKTTSEPQPSDKVQFVEKIGAILDEFWDNIASSLPRRYRTGVHIATAASCFAAMWAQFGMLVWVRSQIITHVSDEDPETEWSFGQILALSTWVPVLVEWTYIFLFGMEEGLEGRMPEEYGVHYAGSGSGEKPTNVSTPKLDSHIAEFEEGQETSDCEALLGSDEQPLTRSRSECLARQVSVGSDLPHPKTF